MTPGDWIQLVIAIMTAVAAGAAWKAAVESKRATQATLFSELMRVYDSEPMQDALRSLARLKERAQPTFEAVVESWAKDAASDRPEEGTLQRDRHRRLVSHFFWTASRLMEDGLISDGLAEELRDLSGRRVMLEVVVPLERALHAAAQTSSVSAMNRIERFKRVFFPTP